MATLDELHQALVNADAAGDRESAQALADHIRGMQGTPTTSPALQVNSPAQNWSNIGAESMATAGIRKSTSPAQTMQGAALSMIPFNLGAEGGAAVDTALGRGNLSQNYAKASDTENRFANEHPLANFGLSIPGNVAATMAIPFKPLVQGLVGGAAQGFGSGEGGVDRFLKGGVGAAVGLGTSALVGGTGKALSQPNLSPDVQTLLDAKVRLTPGQIMGGTAKKIEDRATSVPIVGDMISARQGASINDMNRAVGDRVLEPIGKTIPNDVSAGRQLVAHVKQALSNAYDGVLGKMSAVATPDFATEMQSVIANAQATLPANEFAKFQGIVNAQLRGKFTQAGAAIDGDTIKGIESELSKEIKGYGRGSWDEQKLASSISDAQTAFRGLLSKQNPGLADELSRVNKAYANYAVLRHAGKAVGNDGGVFTPSQFQNAVQATDSSAGKGAFASGNARMQDLSDAAKNVLPSKVPDSGTAARIWQGLGALSAGAGATHMVPGSAIPAAAALGTGVAAYTTPGQALLRTLLASQRPDAIAAVGKGLKLSAPAMSAILPLLLQQRAAAQ